MTSQMNVVHNAARLAMADHRAAMPRRPRPARRGYMAVTLGAVGLVLAYCLSLLLRFTEPG